MRKARFSDIQTSGGATVRVRSWAGRGTPLVLLHGLLDSSEGWDSLARATHRPCFAVDLPGFGGSDPPEWPRIRGFAEPVIEALDHLGVDRCILVGHSLGGAVGTSVAELAGPERVSSLMLLAPAGYGPIRLAEFFGLPVVRDLAMAGLPLMLRNPIAMSLTYAGAISHGARPDPGLMRRVSELATKVRPGTKAALLAIVAAGRSERGFHRRGVDYDGRVTAVWGEHDLLVPVGHLRNLQHVFPEAHTEVWAGMGHHPQVEQPERLARLVERTAARARARRGSRRLIKPAAEAA